MDPVSAIGIVAAATQFAGQILTVIEFIASVKEAPKVVQQQLVHIEQLSDIARLIIQSKALQTAEMQKTLQTCMEHMAKIEKDLRKLLPLNGDRSALSKAVIAAFKQKHAEKMFQELERHKMSLILCIHQIDSNALSELKLGARRIEDLLVDTNTNARTILNDVNALRQDLIDANGSLHMIGGNISAVDNKLSIVDGRTITIYDEALRTRKALEDLSLQIQQLQVKQTTPEPRKVLFSVPNRLNSNFVGRQQVLNQLNTVLSNNTNTPGQNRPRVAVIRGMGGQGKTQIALQYCFLKYKDPFTAVFWIDATSKASCESSIEAIYATVKLASTTLDAAPAKVRFVLDFFRRATEPWLFVFDNYDIPDSYLVTDYFPSSVVGAVVVTSRHGSTRALTTDNGRYIELEGLGEDAALDLLYQRSSAPKSDANTVHARDIIGRLAFHGLAITQAASYIQNRRLELKDFMHDYDRRRKLILDTVPAASEYRRKLNSNEDKEIALSVFTTWELSYAQLKQDSVKMKLLTTFAFFNNQDISEILFPDCTGVIYEFGDDSEEQFSEPSMALVEWLDSFQVDGAWDSDIYQDVVAELAETSLVQSWEVREIDGLVHVTLHPLVKDWIKVRSTPKVMQNTVVTAWLLLGSTLFGYWDYNLSRFDLSVPHQQEITRHIEIQITIEDEIKGPPMADMNEDIVLDSNKGRYWCGYFMYKMAKYALADKILDSVWQYFDFHLGREAFWTRYSLRVEVGCKLELGDYETATERQEILIESEVRAHGPDSEPAFRDIKTLADLERKLGNLEGAEMSLEALKLKAESVLGISHKLMPNIYTSLANVLYDRRKFAEAEELYGKALRGQIEQYGSEDDYVAFCCGNLAHCFLAQGKYEEASKLYNQALEIQVKVFGPESPHSLALQKTIEETRQRPYDDFYTDGVDAWDIDKFEEAAEYFEKALAGYVELLGEDHDETIDCRNVRDKSLQMARKQPYDELYNSALEGLKQGAYEEATISFGKALIGYTEVLGESHDETIECRERRDVAVNCPQRLPYDKLYEYVCDLLDDRNYEEAAIGFEKALAGYSELLGEDHKMTVKCKTSLERAHEEWEEARATSQEIPDGEEHEKNDRVADPSNTEAYDVTANDHDTVENDEVDSNIDGPKHDRPQVTSVVEAQRAPGLSKPAQTGIFDQSHVNATPDHNGTDTETRDSHEALAEAG